MPAPTPERMTQAIEAVLDALADLDLDADVTADGPMIHLRVSDAPYLVLVSSGD